MLTAASGLLAGTALAADLPSRRTPPVYIPPPIPVFTWTGAYLGANVGYAWSTRDNIQSFANDAVTAAQFVAGTATPNFTLHQSGITAGGQIGYNYQVPSASFDGGGLVVGIEADAAYTDLNRGGQFNGNFSVNSNYRKALDYLGTVRGRIGFAFNRFLVFGTGGFAYGNTRFGESIVAGNAGNLVIWSGARNGMQTGYAVGGGVEYALQAAGFLSAFGSSAVTIKAEYLYYDLGSRSVNLVGGAGAPFTFTDRARTAGNLVRAGLNFKFGDPVAAPVVARY